MAMPKLLFFVLAVFGAGGVDEQDCSACGSLDRNWQEEKCKRFEAVSESQFVGRHSHATVVFPSERSGGQLALWLIGGRVTEYEKWNFQRTTQRADVYYSLDGASWTQIETLRGDFTARTDKAFLMEDVMDPGDIAPFWERYGHSVDVLRTTNGTLVMVLCGGFTPMPDNDVWISKDGETWNLAGRAPWPQRGYHMTAIFHDKLFVMGGSPLTNDVWAGAVTEAPSDRDGPRYLMSWEPLGNASWSPRAGSAATVQFFNESLQRLFLVGGFGGWPCGDDQSSSTCEYPGARSRNDVWVTVDGVTWDRVVEAAPWEARAWHSLVAWTDLLDPYRDVALSAGDSAPRLWLAGGGYVGEHENNVVRFVDAYYDLWWTRDGSEWTRVSMANGASQHLCTSIECYKLSESNTFVGKYGHTLVPFWRTVDDVNVCEDESYLDGSSDELAGCSSFKAASLKVPSLFFVAGDPGHNSLKGIDDPAQPSSDVYASRAPILCDIDGHKCPYPQLLKAPMAGDTNSFRRRLDTKNHKKTFQQKRTRAGTCPDPLSSCEDALYCEQSSKKLTFYIARNNSASLAIASSLSNAADPHKFAYSAYNASRQKAHEASLAARIDGGVGGYVARLHGCHCTSNRKSSGGVEYSGEYCEARAQFDAAFASKPHIIFFLVFQLSLSVSLLLKL